MTLKRTMCALLAATMLLPTAIMAETSAAAAEVDVGESSAQLSAEESEAGNYGLASNIQDGVIFHAFCWKYNDITAMLPDIAKAGFTSVQTSPPQATDGTGSWWWFYQPKGFYIGSGAMGTKQDLANLCSEAEKYGIKVIADVVANHLAGNHDNIQSDLKDSQYWHPDIGDAKDGNRNSVTHGKIGMPDINTEHSYVQQCVYNYIQELKSVGVDGIRFDAAKHIGLPSEGDQFWPNVTKDSSLWYYGEILNNPGLSYDENSGQRQQAISIMKEYTNYMTVTDSPYGMTLREAFNSGTAPSAFGNYCAKWMGLANNKLLYWGESHDTWSNNKDWGYSNEMSQNVIDRAYALAASRNQITALYFSRPSTAVKDDITIGEKGSTHFTASEVAAVNKFHNAMIGKADYFVNSNGCAVVTRKGGGAVIVKGSGSGYVSVENGGGYAKPGTYKDVVSGSEFTVTATTISGNIGSSGIAVIYDNDIDDGDVSASPSSGTSFSGSLKVTLNAKNVTNTSYKTSEGASGEYTDGQTITIGASAAEGSTVTLTLTGKKSDGTTATATYTYNKTAPKKYPTLDGAGFVFDNSTKNWSTVNAYVYDESGSSVVTNGEWPGVKMTDCGNGYWKYELDSKFSGSSNVQVIFNNGSEQIPAAQQPGYKMASTDKKVYEDGNWNDLPASSNIKVSLASSSASVNVGSPVTLTATATGASGTVTYTFSDGSTQIQSSTKNTATWTPTSEGTYTITVTAKDSSGTATATTSVKAIKNSTDPIVNVDKASGTSFTSETMSLKLTLANATSGTYSVDDGPEKTFTGSTTISIGEGKIGDSTVTVKTTATKGSTTKTYTYTYNKVYQKKTSSSSSSSAAAVTEASGAALASQYKTNPNGLGKQKTISVDGDISDWTSDMLIAQGAANDDPRVYRPNSMYELPVDLYALYGAYDDSNVYLMWEMTNVQDVVAPGDDYPISQGILWQTQELPFFIAIDTGKSDTIGNNGQLQTGGTIWNSGMTITNKFNRLISINTKGGNGPFVYSGNSTGLNPVEIYNAKTSKVKMGYGKGILSSSVKGINGAYGESNNRVVGDVCNNSAAWVDFNTKGHNSGSLDFFYELSIPYSELGITKADVTSNGIGVMLVATFGMSGMDCLPYDVSMNDNADQPDTQSQENNSFEKSDSDNITASFARIGAGDIDTDIDSDTDTDTDDTLPLQVNFGTNKSAPQYTTTSLTLKGIGYGGTAPYKYQFSVDNTVVKASNTTATYTWKPSTAGSHSIKCVITDAAGKTATVTKTFTAESSDIETLTNKSTVSTTNLTVGDTLKITGAATGGSGKYEYAFFYKRSTSDTWITLGTQFGTATTASLKPTGAATFDIKVVVRDKNDHSKTSRSLFTVIASSGELTNKSTVSTTNLTVGDTLKITGAATGGSGKYQYAFFYKRSTSDTWMTIGTQFGTATTASLKPTGAATFDIKVVVRDKNDYKKTSRSLFTVVAKTGPLTNKSTVSTTNLTVGNTLKITGAATGGSGKYEYAFFYKRTTSSNWITLGTQFGTATTATLKPTGAATFDIKVVVRDKNDHSKTSRSLFTVKAATAPLTNTSTMNVSSLKVGNKFVITGSATGGSGNYSYYYSYKRSTSSNWITIGTAYGSSKTASFTPVSAGTFNVRVIIKDNSTAETVTKSFTVTAT